jgi:DNA invertase Pin-like site-specific DNA recombinase
MMNPQGIHKITPKHLGRKAVVYLRQSSLQQVRQHKESQHLQYQLADVARSLGWSQVETVDCDLGSTASIGAPRREGFDRLVGSVALGEVGVILTREVSRLSRTDKDWCHLFEVCQIFDTLVGDEEQLYDLSLLDDQLVLGIKGTLSVVELKVLKARLVQGQEGKARRGELHKLLPVGYVLDADGHVVKDPDRRIREAIELVFRKFSETWSSRQTFMWFQEEGVELPVNRAVGGRMRIAWQLPRLSFVNDMLHNPFYAGAYVYGRRTAKVELKDGRLVKRQSRLLGPHECRVFLRDHHEAYIAWESFEENQRLMARNCQKFNADETVAAVRAGQSLLAGLLRCGVCGRKLHVQYKGRLGTNPRYLCKGRYEQGGNYCLSLTGGPVDRCFSEELLKVISPLGMEASLAAIDKLGELRDDRCQALERQLEQLGYEAQRAFEQYDAVDARHRLVAEELERRWNAKLAEVERTKALLSEQAREVRRLSPEDEQCILGLGEQFGQVWNDPACPVELKKKIICTVVEEVVAHHDEQAEKLRFIVHWKGGSHTEFEVPKPRRHAQKTSVESLEVIRLMAPRYGDQEIAAVLNKLGHRTGKGLRWKGHRVATARRRYKIAGERWREPDPEILSLTRAAKYCGVSEGVIRRLVSSGLLEMQQVVLYAPWEIRRSALDSEPIRSLVEQCRKTGKLALEGVIGSGQAKLFQ